MVVVVVGQVSPALHHFEVTKSSTSFGRSKGEGNVTSAGWQVTMCNPIWHVSSRSGEADCKLLYFMYCSKLYLLY